MFVRNLFRKNSASFKIKIAVFVFFISQILGFSIFWLYSTYGYNISIDALIFHAFMPLDGVNFYFVSSFIFKALIPSVFISLIFAVYPSVLSALLGFVCVILSLDSSAWLENAKAFYFNSFFIMEHSLILWILKLLAFMALASLAIFLLWRILCYCCIRIKPLIAVFSSFVILIFVAIFGILNFKILDYAFKEYGDFYEKNFVLLDLNSLHIPNKKRNLIVILAESLESSYEHFVPASKFAAKMGGGLQASLKNSQDFRAHNLIPHLSKLAKTHAYFSHNDSFGGLIETANTNWTMAGTIANLCAIPQNVFMSNMFGAHLDRYRFLDNVLCISDVLDSAGYKSVAILGYDGRFVGSYNFFDTHKMEIFDQKNVEEFVLANNLKSEFGVFGSWGFKDNLVFEYAKDFLRNYDFATPLALFIPTNDMHIPDGFVDKDICKDLGDGMIEAIKCGDKIISDFVEWMKTQDFYKNTTIVIVGDHLNFKHEMFAQDSPKRAVFNAFINANFSQQLTPEITHNRNLSHFEMPLLMLDSLGFDIKMMNLGRNPIYEKSLLELSDLQNFNKNTTQNSKLYESLWRKKESN